MLMAIGAIVFGVAEDEDEDSDAENDFDTGKEVSTVSSFFFFGILEAVAAAVEACDEERLVALADCLPRHRQAI